MDDQRDYAEEAAVRRDLEREGEEELAAERAERIEPIATKARPGIGFLSSGYSDVSGTQNIYRFDNGYGASVVRGFGTYGAERGRWELAVLRWSGDDWDITYDTPITDDVIGQLSDEDVQQKLREIRDLPRDRPDIIDGEVVAEQRAIGGVS